MVFESQLPHKIVNLLFTFTRPAQGRRVDLISIKRRIDEGEILDGIEDDENCCGVIVKHRKFFEQYEHKKRRKIMKDDYSPITKSTIS